MLIQKNTLSDKETIYLVVIVSMMSLKNLYDEGYYFSNIQRTNAFKVLKQELTGNCSNWHASKLLSYSDTLAKYISTNDRIDHLVNLSFETLDINDGNLARVEICRIGIEGLRDRGLLKGELWHLYKKNLADFSDEQVRNALNEEIFDISYTCDDLSRENDIKTVSIIEGTDLETRLEKLSRLYKDKLITKKVYEEKQAELLSEL